MYFIHHYSDRNKLMQSLCDEIIKDLRKMLKEKNEVTLAVPGGLTPKPLLEKLSLIDLEWSRLTIIPTDERCVPESSELSNSGLIRAKLLQNFASKAKLISFYKPNYSVSTMASLISDQLTSLLPIDICVLGMGTDMHTASIFPRSDRLSDALDIKSSSNLIPISAPCVDELRLTLTARVLRDASKLHILITGAEKKEALDLAMASKDNWELSPVRSVLFRDGRVDIHFSF